MDFAIPGWGVEYGQGYISALKSVVMDFLKLTRSGESSLESPHSESSQLTRILALGIPLPAARSIIRHDYSDLWGNAHSLSDKCECLACLPVLGEVGHGGQSPGN